MEIQNGMQKPEIQELPVIGDRASFLYLEHCQINREDGAVTARDAEGTVHIPAASISVLLLGPGIDVSHRAMELIGDTGISEVEGRPEETEIGYCIGQKYRGKGYATELLSVISDFVGSRFGIGVIWGRVVHGNQASVNVLEKNGYEFVKEEFGAEDDPYGNGMLVYKKEF